MTQICEPGDVVRVRRQRWRVVELRPHGSCAEVALAGAGAANLGVLQRVLSPFDRIERVSRRPAARRAATSAWRRACAAWLAANTPPGSLRAAPFARIDLRPHQLEPALAIIRGRAARVLLADAVGLGKTIQAALVVAELRARGGADRVLVLAPAGLRDQWSGELRERFDLDSSVLDAPALRRRAAELPRSVNPWTTAPLAIASIDYVKQPHVLPSVSACRWDVVIVDEAHGVAGDNERRHAARELCAHARYVLLLSATPHCGDRRQFDELCALGAHGDRLAVFRRTRRDVPMGCRRLVRQLRVSTGRAERRMHATLDAFSRAVRHGASGRAPDTWLALAVLHKRALSSPGALLRSVGRRLETLASHVDDDGSPRQLDLPWTDPDGELTAADDAPAWPSALAGVRHERAWLERLSNTAREAVGESSKLAVLARFLRRVREPAIVFTEYRDTLGEMAGRLPREAALLHGGLSRAERRRAVAEFTGGLRPLLLATDAAAEGLNLQARCRLVINLELPWNPMRLEQRIGRVDRIGQSRTVHAVHLIAAGTGEPRLAAYLRSKIARARSDVGAADPLDGGDDLTPARVAIAGLAPRGSSTAAGAAVIPAGEPDPGAAEGRAEAARLDRARRFQRRAGDPAAGGSSRGPLFATSRHRATRLALDGRLLVIARASIADGVGRTVESTLVPLAVALDRRRLPARTAIADVARWLEARVGSAAAEAVERWHAGAVEMHHAFVSAAIERERRIRDTGLRRSATPLFQPQLFSRRADREREQELAWIRALDADASDRLDLLQSFATLGPCRVDLLLVLGA